MASLRDFLISKVRVKLLQVFLSQPDEIFYVRQLVRKTDEEINAVRRELDRMYKNGMVGKEKRGNRLYYNFREDYLFYDQLLGLVVKTTGLGKMIIKNKNKLGKIKYAMISGKLVKNKERDKQDVDLLIVGEVVMAQLAAVIKGYEKKIKKEINYTVMSEKEFNFRKKRRDPFITGVLLASRIMLIGDETEMVN